MTEHISYDDIMRCPHGVVGRVCPECKQLTTFKEQAAPVIQPTKEHYMQQASPISYFPLAIRYITDQASVMTIVDKPEDIQRGISFTVIAIRVNDPSCHIYTTK